jgi:hypothetical protein
MLRSGTQWNWDAFGGLQQLVCCKAAARSAKHGTAAVMTISPAAVANANLSLQLYLFIDADCG